VFLRKTPPAPPKPFYTIIKKVWVGVREGISLKSPPSIIKKEASLRSLF
jgi:hypothetical protein